MPLEIYNDKEKLILSDLNEKNEVSMSAINNNIGGLVIDIDYEWAKAIINHLQKQFNL
jgi:hypothetical protein